MDAKNWHYHPIGFLAQMRECLTTNVFLSEEAFETEIRKNWNIGLKLIEKRLRQLELWLHANARHPSAPAHMPAIEREYVETHTIHNVLHTTFWENFIYWFGVDPNAGAQPSYTNSSQPSLKLAPAGHHVYNYLTRMREIFRHISMQRVMKMTLGREDQTAYVLTGSAPQRSLDPARLNQENEKFNMEYIHVGFHYGNDIHPFSKSSLVDQNRMEVMLHEVSHMLNAAHSRDNVIRLPGDQLDNAIAYGALHARVLAETSPNDALGNAENIAFFIESAKYEINV